MTRREGHPDIDDADARAIRRASREVGLRITITSSVLVLAVLIAAFVFVFVHIPPGRLFDLHRAHETTIDVGGIDILVGGLSIGLIAVILAGTMSWFATRRAVRPLGDVLRLQRAFVSDASHELRTPLAVLDARLQLLQRGLKSGDPAAPIVTDLRRDTTTLIEIVNDLLALAESGGQVKSGIPVDLNPAVMQAVESMRIVATDRSVTIATTATGEFATLVPAAGIHRCMLALLDNALGFSPKGSTVHVRLTESRGMVRISVRDEGPGITGIDPSRIFDRFARSGAATSDGGSIRPGFGIGLALVRDTVERFGGTVAVTASSGAGTEIELRIPSARTR
ncbi:MAG: two-component system, OmpR family, sensor kinase [Microbacteriaceae bacterium]|nr:two-component system, OmpR family, sensor kinase [Microbacteriaceae bacterium]